MISERWNFEADDSISIKRTHNADHMLNEARYARDLGGNAFGSDYKHVGNVDMALVTNWLKEAGVSWTDSQAVKDVIKRKLMSNEFAALRVWGGSF